MNSTQWLLRTTVLNNVLGNCLTLLLMAAVVATAQAGPAPEASLNLSIRTAGQVLAVGRDGAGRTVIGGVFSQVDGVARNNLARLNVDGSLDNGFVADTNNGVQALAVATDGTIYIGGNFSNVQGVVRQRIARISSAGVLDAAFPVDSPNLGAIRAMALDEANGFLYYGGNFTTMSPTPRTKLAKVSTATGVLDVNFNFAIPGGTGASSVRDLELDGDGGLFVGGNFATIGGQTREALARVFVNGTDGVNGVDIASTPAFPAGAIVYALGLSATHVFAGGLFASPNLNAVKFDRSNAAADLSWNPAPASSVRTLAVGPADSLFLGGVFSSLGGTPRSRLAKLTQSGIGLLDPNWAPSADNLVSASAVVGGNLLVGGVFSNVSDLPRPGLAELPLTAAPVPIAATDAQATIPGGATATYMHPDGSLWIGGSFISVAGQTRQSLARILPNGTLDPAMTLSIPGLVYEIEGDANGRVYVFGQFASAGGQARSSILRLTTGRVLDPAFLAGATNLGVPAAIYDAAISADALFVAGNLDSAGDVGSAGTPRTAVVKFALANGGIDPAWAPVVAGAVSQLPIQALTLDEANDHLYLGGGFQSIDGQAHSRVARVSAATGVLDNAFGPSVEGTSAFASAGDVWSLAVDPLAQQLYVGGTFSSINATAGFESFGRVSTMTGLLDGSFDAGLTVADQVEDILLDTPATVSIAGDGPGFGRVARYYRNPGARDIPFAPNPNGFVPDLAYRPADQTLLVSGSFTMAGVDSRDGLAAFKVDPPMFLDGFE